MFGDSRMLGQILLFKVVSLTVFRLLQSRKLILAVAGYAFKSSRKDPTLTQIQCGRDPDYCSMPGNCVSNCGAKSECGRGAEVPGMQCPLNVCCGPFGYCGTTDEFCTTTGTKVCQSDCSQPPSIGQSGGDIRTLVIG